LPANLAAGDHGARPFHAQTSVLMLSMMKALGVYDPQGFIPPEPAGLLR